MLEFEHWFRSEEACRIYLAGLRWPQGFRCPRCSHDRAWRTAKGLWDCQKCGVDTSVTAGTVFQDSKLSLRIWFRAIWWITSQKSGVSALGMQRVLGLGSYETAWACLHKLRRAMVRPGRDPLTGMVEVDEVILGGHKKGWTRREGGKPFVVIAAEVRGKGIGRIRLRKITDLTQKTLNDFVRGAVAPGSEVITDGSQGYFELKELGYAHQATSLKGRGREASSLVLPRVHRVASLLKRWLLGIHQGRVSNRQLDYYLDEFTFRFNRRQSAHRGMLFYRLLQQAISVEPITFKKLVARGT